MPQFTDPGTCDHPDFAPESYLGTPTYDFYCSSCGRIFSETEMLYHLLLRSERARADIPAGRLAS